MESRAMSYDLDLGDAVMSAATLNWGEDPEVVGFIHTALIFKDNDLDLPGILCPDAQGGDGVAANRLWEDLCEIG
jgi:hypothetical protein